MNDTHALQLNAIEEADLPLLHHWFGNQETYGEFDEPPHPTLKSLMERLGRGSFDNKSGATWILRMEGRPVGFCKWSRDPMDAWVALISVFISNAADRGQGLGTTAHQLCAAKVFSIHPDIEKVEGITDVENKAERRALAKAGFREEGILRARNHLRGAYRDMAWYGLLRHESPQ